MHSLALPSAFYCKFFETVTTLSQPPESAVDVSHKAWFTVFKNGIGKGNGVCRFLGVCLFVCNKYSV